MAGEKSLTEELVEAINMPKLKPIPAYISESDALSVEEFMQCDLAREYTLDTSKITWGGEINNNHVFEMYSEYSATKDSVKLRMEMLTFVSDNSARYDQYCYPLLKMHGLDLLSWTALITYFGNSADTLCLYALSDMLGIHTCVITKNRPWTTIDPNYNGSFDDIMKICQIKLLYLGSNKFGRLWRKTSQRQPSHVGLNYNYSAWLVEPDPPNRVELETARTLLDLGMSIPAPPGPMLECPPSTETDDAMDKIVGKLDCSSWKTLSRPDAMDLIISDELPSCLDVETSTNMTSDHKNQPTTNSPPLDVETLMSLTTPCSVKVRRLESILFEDAPLEKTETPPPPMLGPGEHFTRSKLRPTAARSSRRPRTASTNKNYTEPLLSDEEKLSVKPKPIPQSSGPSRTRVTAQNQRTVYPNQRLPPVKSTTPDPDMDDTSGNDTPVPQPHRKSRGVKPLPKNRNKGVVKMKEYGLKKSKPDRKYSCRMCKLKANSANELLRHHQKKHGIIYCKYCNKAFNNQLSLSRHVYEHTLKRKYVCSICKQSFPFQSQLTYHKRTHRNRRSFFCVFPKCGRQFKNRGDLNRHARTHSKKVYKCTDCDYTNPDKRNFESHRLRHSNIEPHVCPQCGQGFRFNTQKRRHMKTCTIKRSDSPAF